MSVRLEWDGKPTEVERLSLPFQTVETINQSRATRDRDSGSLLAGQGADAEHPANQLIWGDNRLVMSSLLKDYAGKIDLIYIDPPFDTGADFSFKVAVGDQSVEKLPSVIEEHAYRDTWGYGRTSYLTMLYERLLLMHELLSERGVLYLHIGPNVSHYVKLLCDEAFGSDNFRAEIIWKRTGAHSDTKQGRRLYGGVHDSILFFSKGDTWTWNPLYTPYDKEYVEKTYRHREEGSGRRYRLDNLTAAKPGGDTSYEWKGVKPYKGRYWAYSRANMEKFEQEDRLVYSKSGIPQYKRYLDEMPGVPLQDVWSDVGGIASTAQERVGYATQKPAALIERIVEVATEPGDLVTGPRSSVHPE